MDGTTSHGGGWLTHNWKQMYKQIAYIAAVSGYCAVVTALICFVLEHMPYIQLRVDEDAEARGLDEDQIGEFAYDYVEVRRDYYEWGVDTDNIHSSSAETQTENEDCEHTDDNSIMADTTTSVSQNNNIDERLSEKVEITS